MTQYILGFSVPAFTAWVLLRVPNLLNSMMPPKQNLIAKNYSKHKWLNAFRRVFQVLSLVLLIFALDKTYGNHLVINSTLILAILFYVIYIVCWVQYLQGKATPFGLIFGIMLMQPLYIIAIGICLHNRLVIIPAVLYGIASVYITAGNFWPRKGKK